MAGFGRICKKHEHILYIIDHTVRNAYTDSKHYGTLYFYERDKCYTFTL